MLEKNTFLELCEIPQDEFNQSGLNWTQIERIYNHYTQNRDNLSDIIDSFARIMKKFENVQYLHSRIKETDRLIAKIIENVIQGRIPNSIDETNYNDYIIDIVAFRIVYPFKSDWLRIHKLIIENFHHKMIGKPIIYYNIADKDEYESLLNKDEFELKTHKQGYRSINYCLYSDLLNRKYKIDLQLMPVFESAWNCVFDKIKNYKNEVQPLILSYLKILKDLSDSSDHLASNLLFTKESFESSNQNNLLTNTSINEKITKENLKKKLAKSQVSDALDMLFDYLNERNDKTFFNNIVILSGQYKNIQSQITVGMLDFATANEYQNKITNSLLHIIDEIFS